MMMPLKMKRKDLEEVNDDFSDFSLSSPARKIRRLDAELPPIMEEEESDILPVFEQAMPQQNFDSNVGQVGVEGGPLVIEELPENNEERAIVLFKPMNNTPFLQSPSLFSVSSDIISGFKSHVLWSNKSNLLKTSEDKAEGQDKNMEVTNGCLAVVPWVPTQLSPTQGAEVPQPDVSEMMDAEETEATRMDIEDNDIGIEQRAGNEFGGTSASEGLHQWQQQQCMVPQLPQNASTPIVWFQ